jgi:hydrogenase maturation protein HypF
VSAKLKLAEIKVQGIVQGVGFRPYVFRLAQEHNLTGWVRNTSGSVEIEVEGSAGDINQFLAELMPKAPPQAFIERVTSKIGTTKGYSGFVIKESLREKGEYQLISPDIATCPDCQRELFSPEDRRYRYPFTNCTNCGPRFTIIEDIPYDRPLTTMQKFHMCPDCQREYDNPLDRRFHAQPNACPVCGPSLTLTDATDKQVPCEDVIKTTALLLKDGSIVAIKGLGGFLLACDATRPQAVNRLRERKIRPDKPFAVMVADIAEAKRHCLISSQEAGLLESIPCPIVLLRWRKGSSVCYEVAPGLKHLGLMLPYTPLHHLLIREANLPLVMTSGNRSEEPIARDNDEALTKLNGIADYFLMHNRDIYSRYDDSVYIVEGGKSRTVRRARGYAPYPVMLPFDTRQILACGAELKSTFCLTRNRHAFLSQHIGDLENEETLQAFEETIDLYRKLFRIEPEIVAYDMHPEYLSTKYAVELLERQPNLKAVPVQHHHAHIVSCMAENGVTTPVIGVAFDGSGFGTDGHIWGGEFLVADFKGFQRMGHLEYIPMPGGEAAIKKPFRMALGYLMALGLDFPEWPMLKQADPAEVETIKKQIKLKINTPLTSSAGRLCDAVAALAGIRTKISYEAQAAIELEEMAVKRSGRLNSYPFSIDRDSDVRTIRLAELLAAVIGDIREKVPVSVISARFHNTLADIIVQMCCLISEESGIKQVALSGGVFQNRRLFSLATFALRQKGFYVLTHSVVPTNDGCISLGQAAVAQFAD